MVTLLTVIDRDKETTVTVHDSFVDAVDSFVEGTGMDNYDDAIEYCEYVGLTVMFSEKIHAGTGLTGTRA